MRTVRAIGFGFVVVAIAVGTGRAQQAGGVNFIELFLQLDANGDQVIDKGEVPESGRPAFDRLLKEADKNHDEKIDREEYRELLQGLRGAVGPGMANPTERFRALDKNGDGKIARDEFPGPPPVFDRADTNGDGFLSREEAGRFQAAAGGLGPARFKVLDRDGDGKVSKAEFEGPATLFTRMDANKDGMLTQAEADRFTANGGNGFPARFLALDRDNDGRISRDEFRGGAAVFNRLDADDDGFLSLAEFRSAAGGLPKKAVPRPRPAPKGKNAAGSTSSD